MMEFGLRWCADKRRLERPQTRPIRETAAHTGGKKRRGGDREGELASKCTPCRPGT